MLFGYIYKEFDKIAPLKALLHSAQFSEQLVLRCRCETSCWRIAQCNMGCLAIFFVAQCRCEKRYWRIAQCNIHELQFFVARSRTQFYFSQRIAATGNTIAKRITPRATFVAILRQFFQERLRTCTCCFISRSSGYDLEYCKLL